MCLDDAADDSNPWSVREHQRQREQLLERRSQNPGSAPTQEGGGRETNDTVTAGKVQQEAAVREKINASIFAEEAAIRAATGSVITCEFMLSCAGVVAAYVVRERTASISLVDF